MSAQRLNQALNVKPSQTYDDQVDPLAPSTDLEFDLNAIRTLLRLITGEDSWNKSPSTSIKTLFQSSPDTKNITYKNSEFQDIVVPVGQNFVGLSNLGDYPSGNVAIATDAIGVIAAPLPGASGSLHSLSTAVGEGNLIDIREASSNLLLSDSSGNPIKGLLQVEASSVDGDPFSGSGPNSAQISFVVRDPVTESLIQAPISDIQNKTIEYSYKSRALFSDLPEDFAQSLANFSRFSATAAPSVVDENEDIFIPTNGQTNFLLSETPAAGAIVTMFVNGIAYRRNVHFTLSGITLIWTYALFSLGSTDQVVITYRV
jgi:hypothetical protein